MHDEGGHHAVCVDAWLEQSAQHATPDTILLLFNAAFSALWIGSGKTLGEVTLVAIADRVLYNATEIYPMLSVMSVDPVSGIQCNALAKDSNSLSVPELTAGLRFVLVEFLTVIGNLTAEILASELHSVLTSVTIEKAAVAEQKNLDKATISANIQDEASKS